MRVTARNITKDFGTSAALRGVSVDIGSGELVALLGPSGSGKTTLLRIIAGLERPSAGTVLFGDADASNWPVQKRQVGFVFQHYALFRHMTVFDNIAFGQQVRPRHQRMGSAALRDKVMALLRLVQLDGFDGRYPSQLSGGQRQRVALARALAIEPRVLLLDEPFGALDAKVRKDLRRWLRQIHDETGLTTIFVTHDQEEALELADRIVVLNNGHIDQIGTPDQVFDTPQTAFVHGFIGESSQLSGMVRDGQLYIDQQRVGACSGGEGPVRVFIRPQHMRLHAHANDAMRAIVTSSRRVGPRLRLEVRLAQSQQSLEIELDQMMTFDRGAPILIKPERWAVFHEVH